MVLPGFCLLHLLDFLLQLDGSSRQLILLRGKDFCRTSGCHWKLLSLTSKFVIASDKKDKMMPSLQMVKRSLGL